MDLQIRVDNLKDELDDILDEACFRAKTIAKILDIIESDLINADEKIKRIQIVIDDYLEIK